MEVIVDVGVGIAVERLLRDSGHDVLAVRHIDASMTDAEILNRAVAEMRLLITMDKDFAELVYRQDRKHAGVLLLRLERCTGGQKANVVQQIFRQYGAALPGRFSVYHTASASSANQAAALARVYCPDFKVPSQASASYCGDDQRSQTDL